jgi:hypothetical protein
METCFARIFHSVEKVSTVWKNPRPARLIGGGNAPRAAGSGVGPNASRQGRKERDRGGEKRGQTRVAVGAESERERGVAGNDAWRHGAGSKTGELSAHSHSGAMSMVPSIHVGTPWNRDTARNTDSSYRGRNALPRAVARSQTHRSPSEKRKSMREPSRARASKTRRTGAGESGKQMPSLVFTSPSSSFHRRGRGQNRSECVPIRMKRISVGVDL